jgi:hypothetical protein
LFALLSLGSGLASAGPEPTEAELSQARERFGKARQLEDAGRWKEALEQLLRVAEVKMTPQVRFHIALCRENMGLWTEALDGFAQAASEAKGTAPNVMIEANDHIRKLNDSMPTVTLRVNGADASDALFLDRRALPIDDHPLAIRADPGPHRAEVRRGETVVAREFLTLEPKTTRRIELKIGSVAEPPPGWTDPDSANPGHAGGEVRVPPNPGSTQRALAYGALGLAGASAIATGVFIGLRGGALGRLDAACPTLMGCSRSVVEPIVTEGKTYATLVNVFGALTGVAAVGGVVLLFTAPSRPSGAGKTAPPTSLTLSPRVGFGTAGLSVEGVF